MNDLKYGYGIFFPVTIFAGVLTVLGLMFAASMMSDPSKFPQSAAFMASVAPVLVGMLIAIVVGGIVSYISLRQTENSVEKRMRALLDELQRKCDGDIDRLERTLKVKESETKQEHREWLEQLVDLLNAMLNNKSWYWMLQQISEKPTESPHLMAFRAEIGAIVMAMVWIHKLDTQGLTYSAFRKRITNDFDLASANTKHSDAQEHASVGWQAWIQKITDLLPKPKPDKWEL